MGNSIQHNDHRDVQKIDNAAKVLKNPKEEKNGRSVDKETSSVGASNILPDIAAADARQHRLEDYVMLGTFPTDDLSDGLELNQLYEVKEHAQHMINNLPVEMDDKQNKRNKRSTRTDSFAVGEHVYQWCSLAGIPGVFQHHGIVIGIQLTRDEVHLTIVDFSNVLQGQRSSSGKCNVPQSFPYPECKNKEDVTSEYQQNDHATHEPSSDSIVAHINEADQSVPENLDQAKEHQHDKFCTGEKSELPVQDTKQPRRRRPIFSSPHFSTSSVPTEMMSSYPDSVRTYTISSHKWHKVVYQANLWQRNLWRSGTCTAAASDRPGMVMARVFFLMEHPHLVPKYNLLHSNCECMAVWCKTGQWSTLQAMSLLSYAAVFPVKQATTAAAIVSSQQVTVPATGLMGMLGYTTQVSLVSTQPYLLPAIGLIGVVSAAAPLLVLHRAQRAWKQTTEQVTQEFWDFAVREPDIFAECITYWSFQSMSGDEDDDASGYDGIKTPVKN